MPRGARQARCIPRGAARRFAPTTPSGSSGGQEAGQPPVLFEFLACLVRIAFQRANPKFGQYDNKRELMPLPGCSTMLTEVLLPNAKQDMSGPSARDRGQRGGAGRLEEYKPKLTALHRGVQARARAPTTPTPSCRWRRGGHCQGLLCFKKVKTSRIGSSAVKAIPGEPTIPEWSLATRRSTASRSRATSGARVVHVPPHDDPVQVRPQQPEARADDRGRRDDAMACLDLDEFIEAVCRAGATSTRGQAVSMAAGIRASSRTCSLKRATRR